MPSGGNSFGQGLDLTMASLLRLYRFTGRQKLLIGEQLQETEARPHFGTATVATLEIVLTADYRRGCLVAIVGGAEAPKSDDFVDDEAGWHLAARDDQDAGVPFRAGAASPEKRLEIDDRKQLPAQIRDTAQPRLGSRARASPAPAPAAPPARRRDS